MNLRTAAECAFSCGLKTLDEAILNIEMHWPFPYDHEYLEFRELYLDYDEHGPGLVTDFLGKARCEELDREMNEFFNAKS